MCLHEDDDDKCRVRSLVREEGGDEKTRIQFERIDQFEGDID